jgi:sugar phosphate isomerase/epimerase
MTLPIGLQLYTVREQLAQRFQPTLQAIAQQGYVGVELAGLHDHPAHEVTALLKSLNLTVFAMHAHVLTPDGLNRALQEAAILNCPTIVFPWIHPDTYKSTESIQDIARKLNLANQAIQAQGHKLLYHNHDFEFAKIDGRYVMDWLLQDLDPTIGIELDTYWVAVGGADPVETLQRYGERVGMIHVKDGLISPHSPKTAVGDGKMNYSSIMGALPKSVPCLLVEMDECEMDMLAATEKSFNYLVTKGWGHGR